MLLSIQFPFADARAFLNGQVTLLGRPTWPSVSPDADFVRSFGSIRRRRLGGLRGWVGESAICEANRALRFSKFPRFTDPTLGLSVPLSLAFRRLYFDGVAVGKFEVGLATDNKDTQTFTRKQTSEFIKHCLNLPVIVPAISGKAVSSEKPEQITSTVLGQAGKPLARFYAASSISHPPPIKLENWWVQSGTPLLFLVHKASERIHIPYFGKTIPRSGNLNCELSYCEVPFAGRNLRMWVIGLTPYANYTDVRTLRICLLRLHAEHEAMRLILQNIATNRINITPRTNASNTLQRYLNAATKKISRLSSEADQLSEGDLAELARESEDIMNPGARDELLIALKNLDVRKNIFDKVVDYVTTQINIGELNMDTGSKYNISGGQIGAVGDHATSSNNVFNQWNQSGGDLKQLAKDLATLRAELGKQATQPEQFEAAAAVAKAEAAAEKGDGPTVFEHLKKAGSWALGIATSIGIPVAIEALKKAIGG